MEEALERLGPGDRALLELSLRREVAVGDLAELLGIDPDEVGRRRAGALEHLSHELGHDSTPEVEDLLVRHWRGQLEEAAGAEEPAEEGEPEAAEEPAEEVQPEAAEEPAEAEEPEAEPEEEEAEAPGEAEAQERPRRRGIVLALVTLLVIGGGVTAAIIAAGGDEESERPAAKPPPKESAQVPLTALPEAGGARGSVRIHRRKLVLSATGLPEPRGGAYVVWLYDSVADARQLGGFAVTHVKFESELPNGFQRYRYVDVSLEPDDGNPNHSGQSVLRAPLERLTR